MTEHINRNRDKAAAAIKLDGFAKLAKVSLSGLAADEKSSGDGLDVDEIGNLDQLEDGPDTKDKSDVAGDKENDESSDEDGDQDGIEVDEIGDENEEENDEPVGDNDAQAVLDPDREYEAGELLNEEKANSLTDSGPTKPDKNQFTVFDIDPGKASFPNPDKQKTHQATYKISRPAFMGDVLARPANRPMKSYYLVTQHRNWESARQYCESRGASLVAIRSEREQEALVSYISKLSCE